MGAEVLAKRARRDIRRAFAPEASAEVLRFVETAKADIDARQTRHVTDVAAALTALGNHVEDALKLATYAQHGINGVINGRLTTLERQTTLWQRLRWLWSGSWAQ